ncbi:hypothetical protein E6P09_07995 [Haloferax mediterranei ATCC 33500]|uniref:Uncharacterized protein n=1 Tax=Haloferax mediterranei (strain ATCC 33500 / DSM 1411 / JCM 8866 / NBRC 14739 / NCIMB 2177 / R-4) TaxID=523841 RepID=I3R399_HALMT|nr:hypothetical protein [Haloferax mediterranei]AFK18709.1 hypothetical protein HFX_0991 [Haloferax mediterranei ATCC 33500]AHZ21922.1 hypothetical protein BM92_04260 [Haloferax mediterranei ATCC 33500]EMA03431.1 hypothetical protein C439_05515 [Haloferax mediterranei ATCC 33500]MDX5988805.1 hypothetical protein [Haloferax mediterranei ATCC 33500]QCQ75208.1 hypothetical protein E6P09_07995 [Haloferax mediterranei ATCC 33500]
MSWTEVRRDDRIVEWERSDGNATIRLRRGPNTWHVRFDRLHQSPEGRGYEGEQFDDEDVARDTVEAWKKEYDVGQE